MIFKHFLETLHSEHNEGSFKNSHAEPKPQDDRKKESGRSMVEMLGVLAIVGVLSVVGVIGLSSALDSAKANKLIQALSRRATVLAADKSFGTGFTDNASFGQDSDYTITCTDVPNSPLFFCTVSTVPQNVCQKILKMNWELPLRMSPQTCNQTNDMVYVFGEGEAQEKTTACTTDAECTPQATCTEGVCVEPPLKSCDTNVENPCGDECQVCNPSTLLCENACTRKSYLESTGTQYIDTGVAVDTNDTFRYDIIGNFTQFNDTYQLVAGLYASAYFGISQEDTNKWYLSSLALSEDADLNEHTFYLYSQIGNNKISYLGIDGTEYRRTRNNAGGNLYLFNLNSHQSSYSTHFRMKSCKIRKNAVDVRDFIPVLYTFTNEACMYDKVEKKLYHNKGTGSFTSD